MHSSFIQSTGLFSLCLCRSEYTTCLPTNPLAPVTTDTEAACFGTEKACPWINATNINTPARAIIDVVGLGGWVAVAVWVVVAVERRAND